MRTCDEKPAKVATMGVAADDALKAEVREFRNAHPIKISVSAACCYLIRRGLEAVKAEKEAANG